MNVAEGAFAGNGGGGVDIDVLGLAEVFSGIGKALLVLFTLVLDRDNSPFSRWFAVNVLERVSVGTWADTGAGRGGGT